MRITHIFETHVQADHVSGRPAARGRDRRAGARPRLGAGRRSRTWRWRTARSTSWATCGSPSCTRPGHTPDGVSLLVTDRTRGPEPWFVLTGDTLFAGGVGPARSARARRGDRARRAALRQPLRQAPQAPRPHRGLPGALRRLGLRQGAERQARLHHRLRAPVQPGAAVRVEGRVRPLRPRRPAAAARGLRREPPPAISARRERSPGWASARTCPQFSLLVLLNAFVGAMVGLERTVLPAPRRAGVRAHLEDRHHLVHRELRGDEGDHQPRRRPAVRSDRPQADPGRGLGPRPAGPVPHHLRAGLVVDRPRQRAARRQPGDGVVHDRHHEDRSRRARSAAASPSG